MNYIVVYKVNGKVSSLFFTHRDETDIAYKRSTLIRNEDDVIAAMLQYFNPDNGDMVIRETLLDAQAYGEEIERFISTLMVLL